MNTIYGQDVINSKNEFPILLRNKNCLVKSEDGEFLIVANFKDDINQHNEKIQTLFEHFERHDETTLPRANDGIYTWLIYLDGKTIQFICTEVLSPYEIGTRHQSLAKNTRIHVEKVYGGGEFRKTGDRIEFNLQSGTYMRKYLKAMNEAERKDYIEWLKQQFQSFVNHATFSEDTLMIRSISVVPNHILDIYKSIGCVILQIDNEDMCEQLDARIGTLEERIENNTQIIEEKQEILANSDEEEEEEEIAEAIETIEKLVRKNTKAMKELISLFHTYKRTGQGVSFATVSKFAH